MASDGPWMLSALESVLEHDDFTRRLVEIYQASTQQSSKGGASECSDVFWPPRPHTPHNPPPPPKQALEMQPPPSSSSHPARRPVPRQHVRLGINRSDYMLHGASLEEVS